MKNKMKKHSLKLSRNIGYLLIFLFIVGQVRGNEAVLFKKHENDLIFQTKSAKLVISKNPWNVKFTNRSGEIHTNECYAPAFFIDSEWHSVSRVKSILEKGENSIKMEVILSSEKNAIACVKRKNDYSIQLRIVAKQPATAIRGGMTLAPVEEVYGFGETWNGGIAQRGKRIKIYDKTGTPDECAYMPYYVSTQNYAFILNYGGEVNFDVGQTNALQLTYEAQASEIDITFISGASIASAVQSFTELTGKPAMPPRWSYKPWFWLMGEPDVPDADINSLRGEHFPYMVNRLHKMNIPVGVVWLEPPWQTQRTSFIPNPEFCKDLPGLIDNLDKLGVKTLVWTVPYTTNIAENWDHAVEHNYLVQKQGILFDNLEMKISDSGELVGQYYNDIDFFNPKAFNWWKQEIKTAIDLGFRGFKLDAGQSIANDAILHNGMQGKDVHNSYALRYSQVFFEALSETYGNDFLMIPRAAYIGSNQYTNFKWPGDLAGDFANNGLSSSIYSSLSLAFCGFPFVSTDIGGFDTRPPSEQVWIRWAQFGAMLPGMQTLHMPWWFSEEAADHFLYLCWLHTELTPFWMSLANDAHQTGAPVCRPLVWDNQDDIDCWRISDEFMVGNALLAAPLINTNADRDVYLPDGMWYDFFDDSLIYNGKQTIKWFKGWGKNGWWKFPLYVRSGAIIPMEIGNSITGLGWEESKDYVTLAIWPKSQGQSRFTLIDQEKPVLITVEQNGEAIHVRWDESDKDYLLRIHLNDGLVVDRVCAGMKSETKLINFETEAAFLKTKSDGWFLDQKKHKLYIRKNQSINIDLTIYKQD